MVEHVDVPDGDRHPPKGADAATSGQVIFSDGAGDITWDDLPWKMGWYYYEDLATQTTPVSIASGGTYYAIPNDTNGTGSASQPFGSVSTVLDSSTGELDLSALTVGDVVEAQLDLTFTTTAATDYILVRATVGSGSGSEYIVNMVQYYAPTSGTYRIKAAIQIPVLSADIRDNPVVFEATTDQTGDDFAVNSFFVKVERPS